MYARILSYKPPLFRYENFLADTNETGAKMAIINSVTTGALLNCYHLIFMSLKEVQETESIKIQIQRRVK